MITTPSAALLALALASSVWTAQPGVVHVPVVRSKAPSGLQQALRKRANDKYAAVDLQNLQAVYSINISIAGQPTSVVLDTGNNTRFPLAPQPQLPRRTMVLVISIYRLTPVRLTGSFELWVDPNCDTASRLGDEADSDEGSTADSDASSPEYCKSIGRYDPSSSSTAEALDEGSKLTEQNQSLAPESLLRLQPLDTRNKLTSSFGGHQTCSSMQTLRLLK